MGHKIVSAAVAAAFSVVLGLALATGEAQADLLQWDGNGAALPNPAGGDGTWSGTDSNWFNGSTNQAYDTGAAPHDTVFDVTGGIVNLSAPVTARSLKFDISGYYLWGDELNLTGTGEGSRTIAVTNASDAVTINAPLEGSAGLIKTGQGELLLMGVNTFDGLTVLDGTVIVRTDQQLGDLTRPISLDGGTLRVTGSSSLKAAETRNFFVGNAGATFDIQNTSKTGLTIRGILSGTGALVKTGAGTMRLDEANSMFAGGVTLQGGIFRFNNNNDAGPKALRLNSITFAPEQEVLPAGAAFLSLGGSGSDVDGDASQLRTGEWLSASPGAGIIVAATTLTDSQIGASGHDLLVLALADATFSGALHNLATSNGGNLGPNSQNGSLAVRGIATQTLSGTCNVNETLSVFSGAGLTLAGAAAMPGDLVNLNLNGGTFTLDNYDTNLANRFRDAGPVETRGGGTFVLIGNAAGSSETLGKIQLGNDLATPPKPRAGAMNVRVIHHAGGSAATELTFSEIQREIGRATIDFSARDGSGPLALGTAGNAPRILFGSSPSLSGAGLLDSPDGVGWATVNGSGFATYDVATGIRAADTVSFASATAGNNALLSTTEVIGGSSNKNVGSLKISPSVGQTLDLDGSGNLLTPAILLDGPHDFHIRNTGSGTGELVTAPVEHFYVQQADLTVSVPITGDGALVKSGLGTLILEGANTYSGPTTINEGQLRATPGASLGSGVLELRGGVLEITGGGTFNRHLDYGVPSGPGRISWTAVTGLPLPSLSKEDRGSGGFAAVGADVYVDLNGLGPSDIVWEDPSFVDSGYALILGSPGADARVELVDNFGLGLSPKKYNARKIHVIDNPNSTADVARLSGIIFSDSAANRGMLTDLLKTGDGTLELTGNNTYIGGTIVAEGTLLLGHANALGQPAEGAYVLLGNRGGAADAAMLTSAPISIARDITIPVGSSGRVTIGTAAAGSSSFTGEVTIGTGTATADKTVDLFAEADGTVVFSAGVSTARGYAGMLTLTKNGRGEVVLDATSTHNGDTLVAEGTLRVDGTLRCLDLVVAQRGTLAGNGLITSPRSGFYVMGTLSPGGSVGELTALGFLAFAETATYQVEIGGNLNDKLLLDNETRGVPGYSEAILSGSLSVQGLSPITNDSGQAVWGDQTLSIMELTNPDDEGGFFAEFGFGFGGTIPESYAVAGAGSADQPVPNQGTDLGNGMWFGKLSDAEFDGAVWNNVDDGVYYVDRPDPDESATAVEIGVFQAAPGDTDGNRKVEGQDILNILQAGLFGDGVTPEANWGTGDFNGDHKISGEDILALLGTGLFGDGTYPDSAAAAATGADVKLIVTADGLVIDTDGATVTGFVLNSKSGILTGDDAENIGLFQEDTDATISGTFAMSLRGEHALGDVISSTV